ncbi:54S ribosomal protein L7, mitochondrial [Pleodorina starrii]|uniref:54S ribosomal protein L7, mitochondrial n=1 Tax=Pleodorina starrii TaxID=330485 RepID=A0A9W6BG06_9CHLO|nr:54S ribosomal protein L7 [Pleodorina starrii]GLC50902.1 54S ribosomal protein L7, mitochondrial [Pleodorina starrii]GLC73905.1 54S ribosomal protein L7 [Pleodorina starrii]
MTSQAASSLLCSSRCLASALRNWSSPVAAFQCAINAAFSAQAQAATAASDAPSTSGRGGAAAAAAPRAGPKAPSGSTTKKSPTSSSSSSSPRQTPSTSSSTSAAALAAAASHLAPCRLSQYVHTVLHRELMLKLGPRGWDQVPRLVAVEARVRASETHLATEEVDKWELLLYSLALETLTGRTPTFTPPANSKNSATRAAGVFLRLDARSDPDAVYGFLEKLVHVVLPNQVGFAGLPPPTLVGPPPGDKAAAAAAARAAANDHRRAPLRPHATEFRVSNLLQYPDFEQNFWLFEQLGGMRVRLVMEGASAADCGLLLSGLSLPVLTGAAAEAALAELAQEALRRGRTAA